MILFSDIHKFCDKMHASFDSITIDRKKILNDVSSKINTYNKSDKELNLLFVLLVGIFQQLLALELSAKLCASEPIISIAARRGETCE